MGYNKILTLSHVTQTHHTGVLIPVLVKTIPVELRTTV